MKDEKKYSSGCDVTEWDVKRKFTTNHRLGIIIPYRDRAEHLKEAALVLKQFGHIYVVEQMDKKPFNRGKLINAGYKEFNKEFDYFAAHDVDMIPEANVNYAYAENPCHLATEAEQFGYRLPYPEFFGGVTIFPKDKFEKVNGFSNEMWGWSAEDDYIRKKFIEMSIPLQSRQCRFISLPHNREIDRELRKKNVERLRAPIEWGDGLSSCEYEIVHCEGDDEITLLQVRL